MYVEWKTKGQYDKNWVFKALFVFPLVVLMDAKDFSTEKKMYRYKIFWKKKRV